MPDALRGIMLTLALALLCGTAAAQDIDAIKSNLQKKMEALESASKAQKELHAREEKLRRELASLQSDLVGKASKIQRQEKLLSELESNLVNLEDEERQMSINLARRERELGVLVQSMLKLSTIPPEMVVAMPGDFEATMRTAKVLALTSNALSTQAKDLNRQLVEIKALQEQIRQNHTLISQQKTLLETDKTVLESKLDERGEIHNQLHSRQEEQQAALRALSEESNTLRDLMSQLEARRKEEEQKAAKLAMIPQFKPDAPSTAAPIKKPSAPATKRPASQGSAFATAKGKIALPAEGKIFTFYGDKTEDGDDSRGIRIRTRAGAQVTSPFAGEVVYTGTFLDYGNMVIIRHENDYHSLLAGMERVTATLNQTVIEGEPLGEMGRAEDKTALYMEIRERNRPIDPIPWLQNQRLATR